MPKLTGFEPCEVRGPKALPFFGLHVNFVRFFSDPVGRMLALHREFGNVASIVDRSPALVCAFGAELNREVLSNGAMFENDSEFLFKPPAGSALACFKNALTFQVSEGHKRHRRLMMPALGKSAIDAYAPLIGAVAEKELDRWPVGTPTDVEERARQLVQRVAVRCLFGLDGDRAASSGGGRSLGTIAGEVNDLLTSPLTIAMPFDVPGTPFHKLMRVSEEFAAKLRELIALKRRPDASDRDALALLVNARDDDGKGLSDEELIGEAAALYVAGHDTQARTIGWTLFLLSQHPAIAAAVVSEEIDAVLGGSPAHASSRSRKCRSWTT